MRVNNSYDGELVLALLMNFDLYDNKLFTA